MKNLKFTFNELVRKPFSGIIIIAQIALSVSILTQGLTNMFSAIDNLKQTEKILKNNNVYSLESADLDNEIENMEGKDNEYKKFYKYLHNTYKKNMICSMGASFLIKNFTSDSKFYSNKDEKYVINPEGIEGTYSQVQSCYIDKNFYNAFPFSTISGRGFKNSDFNQKNVIPVILGYEYKGIYKVGDTFNIYDCYFSKKVKKIKVIGILKKNSYCLSNGTSLNNLDNEILSPIGYMDKSNINANCYMNYLNSSFIITNNKDKA